MTDEPADRARVQREHSYCKQLDGEVAERRPDAAATDHQRQACQTEQREGWIAPT